MKANQYFTHLFSTAFLFLFICAGTVYAQGITVHNTTTCSTLVEVDHYTNNCGVGTYVGSSSFTIAPSSNHYFSYIAGAKIVVAARVNGVTVSDCVGLSKRYSYCGHDHYIEMVQVPVYNLQDGIVILHD